MATTENQQVTVKKTEQPITEMVLNRVNQLTETGGLDLPKDYSASNAVRSAYLIISDMRDAKTGVPITQVVTKESIYNSLFNMTTQGLNPAKKQCSFIQYGNKLHMQREYAGSIALAKRYSNMVDIFPGVIYEGDVFEYKINTVTGRKEIIKHEQVFENILEDKIKGAYAIKVFEDGSTDVDVMTMAQIKNSWKQGSTKGESPAHKNFPSEMAKKTVLNRACKLLIASSDDSVLMEPGEDGRIPRQALPSMSADPAPEPQTIDIPEEPVQVAEEVKEQEPPKGREWKGNPPVVEVQTDTKAPF